MKILLLADAMEVGGVETHLETLAQGLLQEGHEVHLLSTGGRAADRMERQGVILHRLSALPRTPIGYLWLRGRLRRIAEQEGFAILHAHTRRTALLLAGRGWRGGRVVTVHAAFARRGPLDRFFYWGDRTLAISEDLRARTVDLYRVPATAVEVICNGVDTRRFCPPPTHLRREQEVVFVSRMDRSCSLGARLLCRVAPRLAERLPELRITLCGGGGASQELRAIAAEVNRALGREVIRAVGDVASPLPYLCRASVFVGVSRAAMEAGACGCAVILCGDEGYGGVWETSNALRVENANLSGRGDAPACEERLEQDLWRLLSQPAQARRLGSFACERVKTRFSANEMCRRTLEVYRRLVLPPVERRILIGGYAGCGNLGDDAILLGALEAIRAISPSAAVTALAAHPRRSGRFFGVRCVGRMRPLAIAGEMCRADAFLSGGGTLLQNETGRRSLWYYLFLLRLSKRFGCRTALYSAGIGPLLGARAEQVTRRVLSGVDRLSLREEEARRRLCGMGLSPERISVGADAAFLLRPPPQERTAFLFSEHGIAPGQRCLLIALRPAEPPLHRILVSSVRHLAQATGLFPVFLAFDEEEDAAISAWGARAVGGVLFSVREPADALAILRGCELAIVMRLHAMILATVAQIPAVGLCADGKLGIFARLLGQRALPRGSLTVASLCDAAQQEWHSRERSRHRLADTVREQRKKAYKDLENLLDLIYNKGNEEFRAARGAREETLL